MNAVLQDAVAESLGRQAPGAALDGCAVCFTIVHMKGMGQ